MGQILEPMIYVLLPEEVTKNFTQVSEEQCGWFTFLAYKRRIWFSLCPSEIARAFSFLLEMDDLGFMSLLRGCLIYHHM